MEHYNRMFEENKNKILKAEIRDVQKRVGE